MLTRACRAVNTAVSAHDAAVAFSDVMVWLSLVLDLRVCILVVDDYNGRSLPNWFGCHLSVELHC